MAAGSVSALADSSGDSADKGQAVQDDVEYVPMYRLYNAATGEHLYTADKAERNSIVPIGWRYEGIGWWAPVKGDPVYRLYNPYADQHFYTTDKEENDMLVGLGWNSEGIGWHSSSKDDAKSVPLYRQYNPYDGQHNYTLDAKEEKTLVKAGWIAEGIGWYGHAAVGGYKDDMEVGSGIYSTKEAGVEVAFTPAYRLYIGTNYDHMLTTNKQERNSIVKSLWHYEGVGWQAASAGNPVYRLSNPYTGTHMFTMNADESGTLLHAGWRYEGIAWYSCEADDADRISVFRLYDPNTAQHFFTQSKDERDALKSAGWKDEGIAWYGHAVDEGFQDDMAVWTPGISGDAALDTQLEIILFYHTTLRAAYNYVTGFSWVAGSKFYSNPRYLSDETTISFAKEMLSNGGGNCYRFASLFAWLARGLGYDAYVVSGWVPSYSMGRAPHGWVEVYVDGKAYVCDPDLAHEIGGNWYMFTYDNAPTTYGSW